MTMVASAFVDTNILLRALNSQMDQHIETNALIQQMWDDETDLWISSQVIREFLVQVTHPNTLKPPLAIEQVMRRMEVITTLFRVADDTPAVTAHLLILLKAYPTRGKQVHDANIVATMLANGIDTLLTLNVDDFNRFKDRIMIVSLAR